MRLSDAKILVLEGTSGLTDLLAESDGIALSAPTETLMLPGLFTELIYQIQVYHTRRK
jgi:multimeric flavodoxin WrbA